MTIINKRAGQTQKVGFSSLIQVQGAGFGPVNFKLGLNDLPVQSLKRNDDPPQIISIAPISQLSLFISKNTSNSYLLAQEPLFSFDSMFR